MSALREVQAAWRTSLLGGDASPAAAGVVADGLAPAARLAIYRHHVATSLTELLEGIYPVVCRLVDRHFFAYAMDRFIAAHPPAGPCLFEYGAALAAFLAAFEPCRHLAWLPDVARFEWAMHRAYFAEDASPLDARSLADIATDDLADLRLRLDPSVTLLSSPFAVDEVWRANQPDGTGAATCLDGDRVHLEVRRRGDGVVARRLDAATWTFRAALDQGATLTAAAERALAAPAAFDLARACRDLLAEELAVAWTHVTRKEHP